VAEAEQALRAEFRAPLALDRGQVWRAALVPLAGARVSVFGYVVHHIAFDGWSEAVLAADLGAAYRARRQGRAAIRPLPPSLAEAQAIRQDSLRHADLDAQGERRTRELRGIPALAFPAPVVPWLSRPDRQPEPEHAVETIGPTDVARLDATAAAAGVTRFAVLVARYGQVLAELTGQDDFGVGVPVAQRGDHRLADAVGCHVNVGCVRLRGEALAGGTRSAAATGRLVARSLLACDLGLGEVVRLVNPPRSSRAPLFQTLFAYQDNAVPRLRLDGAATRFIRQPYLGLPTELQADAWPQCDGGLRLVVSAQPTALPAGFARLLARKLADLLRDESKNRDDQWTLHCG
jgi:hypothetical protein